MDSIWKLDRSPAAALPQLVGELDVEVVVVGGGATGLATASLLCEAGASVAVLEARRVGMGSSGGSTGNLYSTLSQGLSALAKKWDQDTVNTVVNVRRKALDSIQRNVERWGISCDFARRSIYLGAGSDAAEDSIRRLDEEYKLSRAAGLDCELVDSPSGFPLPFSTILRIDNQAQFNPLHYCEGLAAVLQQRGLQLFESSPVIGIDPAAGEVRTPEAKVRADHIVLATHTPKGINMLQAEMEPYREHGIALPLLAGSSPEGSGLLAPGIYWGLDDSISLRRYSAEGQDYLILVGGKYKTGKEDAGRSYWDELEAYARRYFKVGQPSHRWSAQQYQAADLLPSIGRSGHDNVHVATGYAADGLVWSEAAAQLISQQILERENGKAALFNPRRFTPAKSAKAWLEANTKVAGHLTTDHFSVQKADDFAQLAPGEGQVIKVQGDNYAAYRAADGQLSLLSPVCPHMKCIVHWNSGEKSWDCPCHGSRFDTSGAILEGPALHDLEVRQPPAD